MTTEVNPAARLFPNNPTQEQVKAAEAKAAAQPKPAASPMASTSNVTYGDTDYQFQQGMRQAGQPAPAEPQPTQPQTGDQPGTTFKADALPNELSPEFFTEAVAKSTPDVDVKGDAMASSFVQQAHKMGLKAEQATAAINWYQQQAAQHQAAIEAEAAKLPGATIDSAKAVVSRFADANFKSFLNDSGAGSHPALISFLAKVQAGHEADIARLQQALHEAQVTAALMRSGRSPLPPAPRKHYR